MRNLIVSSTIRNFINLNVLGVIGLIIPIITIPLLSSALGPKGLSHVFLGNIILQIGILIIDYSFNLSSSREIVKLTDRRKLEVFYKSVQSERYFLLIIFVLLILIYLGVSDTGLSCTQFLLYILPGIFGHIWFATWFHLGLSILSQISIMMFSARIVYLFLIINYVKTPDDINLAFLANSLPMVIAGGVALLCRYSKFGFNTKKPVFSTRFEQIKKGRDLFIADFSPNLYNSFPGLYLANTATSAEFSSYAIATRIINAFISVQIMLGRAMLPSLSVAKNISVANILVLNILLASILFILTNITVETAIRLLVGDGYGESVVMIRVLSFSLLFVAVINSISTGYFIPKELDKYFRELNLNTSILAFVIGIPLIYFWNVWGGIILVVVARALLSAILLFHYKSSHKI